MKAHASAKAHIKATAWARAIAAEASVVFLDTETTGLGEAAEICDVGIVGLDGTGYLDLLIRPSQPIPAGATQVHGITDAMVATAPTFAEAYERIAESIAPTVVVYNRDYDLGILNRQCAQLGLPPFAKHERWECAMRAFGEWEGAPGKHPGSFRWFKLDDAAGKFGIPPGGHRALADARVARLVVLAMAEHGTAPPPEPVEAGQPALFSSPDPSRFTR